MSIDFDSDQNRLTSPEQTPLLVPTVSLDGFEGPPPDLIKIDVEGAEARVLRGCRRILSDFRPVLFLALHGDDQRTQCARILRDCGYKLCTLDGAGIEGTVSVDEVIALLGGPDVRGSAIR